MLNCIISFYIGVFIGILIMCFANAAGKDKCIEIENIKKQFEKSSCVLTDSCRERIKICIDGISEE